MAEQHQQHYSYYDSAYPPGSVYTPGPSSAPSAQHVYAHAHPTYAPRAYASYDDPHSPTAPSQLGLSAAPSPQSYYGGDAYPPIMQRPYVHPYASAEPPAPQFAPGMPYTHSPAAQRQPSLPVQPLSYPQQHMPGRGYYQQEALDKLHLHPHAHRAVMSVPSQQPTAPSPVHPEPPPERPSNTYAFVPTVPGPLSGPVLAPEFQQSLAYSRSPASVIPSTLPAVPSTSGPSSSRQSDSTGSISPRTTQDHSLPAPVFSTTSPVVKQGDILITDPSVKNRKFVVERDITCIKCSSVIGHLLLRGTQEEFAHEYSLYFQCTKCHNAPVMPIVSRKRTRTTEDTSLPTVCDVCHRTRGIGGVVMKDREVSVPYAIEIPLKFPFLEFRSFACLVSRDIRGAVTAEAGLAESASASGDVRKCSRKTCRLSHARLGHGELEIGVWRAPQELKDQKDLLSVIASCKKLWQERVLSKLATPESQDAEDRGAVSMGEVLGQILKDREEHNAKHPDSPVPPPLHLWVGIKAVSPVHGAKFIDSMNRRGFLSLSEYVARHPDVDAKMFDEPPFGHMWLDDPWAQADKTDTRPIDILVRWLGKDLDEAQLEKLKGIEYGKRARETGRAKRRR
ncbi:hypothetical protein FRC09_001505 [Ceratobasidium sp. 395]|nr:hypothetical protein FRC09_001505 [Ceratobasidium sp. 395]